MSVTYNIDCHHCGTHTEHTTWIDRHTAQHTLEELTQHIDTEFAIRCPACRARLNRSAEDFRSQVTIAIIK
jgi:DNA-directed RNA polymerase subunit RPC12/RpoP